MILLEQVTQDRAAGLDISVEPDEQRALVGRLGKLKVDQIDGPLIRDVLAEIWLEIPETARRVADQIGFAGHRASFTNGRIRSRNHQTRISGAFRLSQSSFTEQPKGKGFEDQTCPHAFR